MTPRKKPGSGSAANCFRDGAVVALVLSCGFAFAADPAKDAAGPAATYRVDQPSQPMAESLREIARLTGSSVLFDPAKVSGRRAHAVTGQLSVGEAIAKAIEGSGLESVRMADGSIVIRTPAATGGGTAGAAAASAPATRSTPPLGGGADLGLDESETSMRVAQALQSMIAADGAGDENHPTSITDLGKVEVTGSRLKRITSEGPTPVYIYSRKDIERSGQPTLERFISSLNESSVSSGEGGMGQTTGQGTVQLRGLPLGSTLVLINGRRLQAVGSSSGNYFNLNLIPMAAVERVEIVPVGSSAVYGGDALAGVVNIILKKSLEGVAMDARLGSGKGIRDGGFSLGTGGHGAQGTFLLLGAYNKTTPLTMAERGFFRDGDYRRFGGTDGRTRSCTPGTVTSTTGTNLPGLNSTLAGIPSGAAGQLLSIADFAATAGQPNLCNPLANGNGTALVYGSESFSLHASGEHPLSESWQLFGEMSFSRDQTTAEQSGLQLNNVLVPAANPYNPFGVPVRVTERLGLVNGAESLSRNTDFKRMLVGVRGDISGDWDAEASFSTTRDDGERHSANNTARSAALNAALGATTLTAALNPFTTGVAARADVLQSIWYVTPRVNHGKRDQASAFVRGPLLTLPTGKVDVIAGMEMARDHYQTVTPGSFDIEGSRSSSAVYGEMHVPLWRSAASGDRAISGMDGGGQGAKDGEGSRELAALTLAGRHDRYNDFGGASTFQAGLEIRPTKSFLLRGSAATSFKPPTILNTHVDEIAYTTEALGLVDPARSNAPVVGGQVLRTTNPDLHPEKGQALSFGAVWEPESSIGTRLAATAWQVKIDGLIALLWPQVTLDNEALFPGMVTRAPSTGGVPGPITNVQYMEVNFGHVTTSGIDMELAHAWKMEGGKWTASATATRATRYDVAVTPAAPVDDRVGHRATDFWSPKWKGRLALGLDRGSWSLGMTSRYLGAYEDPAPSHRSLGNYWLHDLAASFNLKRMGVSLPGTKDAVLSIAIANLANRMPEYVSTYPYYDVTQADWRGRYANLRLSVNW